MTDRDYDLVAAAMDADPTLAVLCETEKDVTELVKAVFRLPGHPAKNPGVWRDGYGRWNKNRIRHTIMCLEPPTRFEGKFLRYTTLMGAENYYVKSRAHHVSHLLDVIAETAADLLEVPRSGVATLFDP